MIAGVCGSRHCVPQAGQAQQRRCRANVAYGSEPALPRPASPAGRQTGVAYPATGTSAKMFVVTNASRGAVCEEVRQRSVDRRPSGVEFRSPMPLTRTVASAASASAVPTERRILAQVRLRKSAGNLRSILRQSKISRTMIPVGKYATGCQTNRLPRRRHPMDALQPIGSNLILRNFRIFLSENPSSC